MISNVISAMIQYYAGDKRRIEHFIKVYTYAKCIGEQEKLEPKEQEILEVAAVLHDIGIKISEEKYQSSAGKYQELEGPALGKEMLEGLGYAKEFIDRVCFLIGHHHTYDQIDGMDYQILVEADFLVNLSEENSKLETIQTVKEKIFRTKAGITYLDAIFLKKTLD